MKNPLLQQRILLGACIVFIGTLALLDNLKILSTRDYIQFWPMVFIAFGLLKITQANGRSGYFIGAAFIAVGTLMTLNHLEVIHFRMREWWPLLIILAGVAVIFKDRYAPPSGEQIATNFSDINANDQSNPRLSNDTTNPSRIDIMAMWSGNKVRNTSANFQGGELNVVMAGVELDLRGASIQGDAVLNVFTVWGGIEIKVPNDWTVVNNCNAILGGIDDRSVPAMQANKRLIISGYAIMGGVEIKN